MFKVLPPPYTDDVKFTLRRPPPGYLDEGYTGEGMVKNTLQVIGGKPPANIENVDLGVVTVNIKTVGDKPYIEFRSDADANIGAQSIGQGEEQISVEEWKQAKKSGESFAEFRSGYEKKKQSETEEREPQPQEIIQEVSMDEELEPTMEEETEEQVSYSNPGFPEAQMSQEDQDEVTGLSDEDVMGGSNNMSDLLSVSNEDIMGRPPAPPKKRRMSITPKGTQSMGQVY
jgi:hypothetical protein